MCVFLSLVSWSASLCQYSVTSDANDCSKYNLCVNETIVPHSCPSLQIWNCVTNACSGQTFKPCCPFDTRNYASNNHCNIKSRIPDYTNCTSFYECRNEVMTKRKCRDNRIYDLISQRCVKGDPVYCSPDLPRAKSVFPKFGRKFVSPMVKKHVFIDIEKMIKHKPRQSPRNESLKATARHNQLSLKPEGTRIKERSILSSKKWRTTSHPFEEEVDSGLDRNNGNILVNPDGKIEINDDNRNKSKVPTGDVLIRPGLRERRSLLGNPIQPHIKHYLSDANQQAKQSIDDDLQKSGSKDDERSLNKNVSKVKPIERSESSIQEAEGRSFKQNLQKRIPNTDILIKPNTNNFKNRDIQGRNSEFDKQHPKAKFAPSDDEPADGILVHKHSAEKLFKELKKGLSEIPEPKSDEVRTKLLKYEPMRRAKMQLERALAKVLEGNLKTNKKINLIKEIFNHKDDKDRTINPFKHHKEGIAMRNSDIVQLFRKLNPENIDFVKNLPINYVDKLKGVQKIKGSEKDAKDSTRKEDRSRPIKFINKDTEIAELDDKMLQKNINLRNYPTFPAHKRPKRTPSKDPNVSLRNIEELVFIQPNYPLHPAHPGKKRTKRFLEKYPSYIKSLNKNAQHMDNKQEKINLDIFNNWKDEKDVTNTPFPIHILKP